MSESDKPKDPRAPGAGAFPDAPGEKELDDALATAADLAAGLANEVRESDPPMPRTSAKDERLALDQELAELERLAHKAAADLGSEETAAKPKKKRSPTPMPDFMSELTGPAPAPAAARREAESVVKAPDSADTVAGEVVADAAAGARSSAALGKSPTLTSGAAREQASGGAVDQASEASTPHKAAFPMVRTHENKPGVVRTGPQGVVGEALEPIDKSDTMPATDGSAIPKARGPGGWAGLGAWASLKLYPAVERVVRVLEVMDRPFGWLGQSVKQAIGWFAIATLLTSVIVFVVAMMS